MAGSIEVQVLFGPSVSLLKVRDYSDLTTQTKQTLSDLPNSFIFTYKDGSKTRNIDSQRTFRLITKRKPLALTVIPAPEVVCMQKQRSKPSKSTVFSTISRVGLSNLAFISHQKDAVIPDKEVINVEPTVQRTETPVKVGEDQCPVCMEGLRRPLKAKCGHKLCTQCWESVLAKFLECPVCRGRARMKTLRAC